MRPPPARRLSPGLLAALVVSAACLAACGPFSSAGHPHHDGRPRHEGPSAPASLSASSPSSTTSSTTTTTTLPPTTTTRPPPPSTTRPAAPGLVAGRVTVIGDSVTIDAAGPLRALIAHCEVDAVVGMQWETGVATASYLRSHGELGSVVVIALGSNGTVTPGEFAQMMAVLHGVSRVVIVNNHVPDSWGPENNALFASEVPRYAVDRLANWSALAQAHPGWFYSDGVHMPIGGTGAYAFARLVRASI